MKNLMTEEKIRTIVREEVKNQLDELFLRLKLEILPFVSKDEQKEIEEKYGDDLLKDPEKDVVYSKELN